MAGSPVIRPSVPYIRMISLPVIIYIKIWVDDICIKLAVRVVVTGWLEGEAQSTCSGLWAELTLLGAIKHIYMTSG